MTDFCISEVKEPTHRISGGSVMGRSLTAWWLLLKALPNPSKTLTMSPVRLEHEVVESSRMSEEIGRREGNEEPKQKARMRKRPRNMRVLTVISHSTGQLTKGKSRYAG